MPYKDAVRAKQYKREYRQKNHDIILVKQREYHQENREQRNQSTTKNSHTVKITVLAHYCNSERIQCAHCSEARLGALNIDHINGGGKKHRKEFHQDGSGIKLYYWLMNHGYPLGFRVLCANCNWRTYLTTIRTNLSIHPRSVKSRRQHLATKVKFMAAIGGQCAVCGETDIDVLTCHHTNNDGKAHRQEVSEGYGGLKFYRAVNKSGNYSGLECRCFSCNDEEAARREMS
jgi:hypothetical protein